jgi:tetratricopeptide (TPR) repeat protein
MGKHFERGMMLFQLRRWREAIGEFTEEIVENPQSPDAFAARAAAYTNLKQSQRAESDAKHAVSLEPEFAYAFYVLSVGNAQRKRRRAAKRYILDAIRLESDPNYLRQLAALFFDEQKYTDCLKTTQQALEIDPLHEPSLVLQAQVLARLNRFKEAEILLRSALALHAENPEAHQHLGAVILQSGKTRQALDHLLEARRIDPIDHNDRLSLAGAYGRLFWPLNKLDALLAWKRELTICQRWLFAVSVSTALIIMYLFVPPDPIHFSFVLPCIFVIAIANWLALHVTLEWLAVFAAVIRLRKQLDIRWRHVVASSANVFGAIVAHIGASLLALIVSFLPWFVFFALSACHFVFGYVPVL